MACKELELFLTLVIRLIELCGRSRAKELKLQWRQTLPFLKLNLDARPPTMLSAGKEHPGLVRGFRSSHTYSAAERKTRLLASGE